MPWDNDAARKQVFSALLILQETLGEDETIALLRNELTRLTVLQQRRHDNAEILHLHKRVADLGECLNTAVDALGFYADEDNYADRPGKPSAVRKDKGTNAREALEAINAAADAPEETP